MHLISPLISGIRGAEDGAAQILRRGTSTFATLYSSFEGDPFPSSGLDSLSRVILDSHGRAEVYVDTVCDVNVFDADGTDQIGFTAGYAASAIEVRSASFTGAEYDGSGTGTSEPVNLQAVLDLWNTTHSGSDWELSVTGSLPVYNVKDEAYGAVGDGVVDDTTSVQAAITAASAVGGIVFFPSGEYRVTSTLTANGVRMLGEGSLLTMNHATADLLEVQGVTIEGLNMSATGTGTVLAVAFVDQVLRTRVVGCSLASQGQVITVDDAALVLLDCSVSGYNSAGDSLLWADNTVLTSAYVSRCTFTAPGTYTPADGGMAYGNNMYFDECVFNAEEASVGAFSFVKYSSGAVKGSVTRCRFTEDGGATITSAIDLGAYGSGARFYESDNDFQTEVPFYTYTASASSSGVHLGTRDKIIKYITDNTGTIAIPTDQFGVIIVSSTHASPVMTGTLPPYGARGTVFFYHPSGGAGTARPTTNFFGTSNATTADTSTHAWEYVCAIANSALRMLVTVDGKALGNGAP